MRNDYPDRDFLHMEVLCAVAAARTAETFGCSVAGVVGAATPLFEVEEAQFTWILQQSATDLYQPASSEKGKGRNAQSIFPV